MADAGRVRSPLDDAADGLDTSVAQVSSPVEFEKLEYHWPDRYYVGKTGERQEKRVVTVEEYAWTCEKCPARGVDYEDERAALDAAVRHQAAAHAEYVTSGHGPLPTGVPSQAVDRG